MDSSDNSGKNKCELHKCNSCNKVFAYNSSLLKHMRIHKGERPYLCGSDGCNQRFSQVSNLIRHKRIHSGSKPYDCKECEKSFSSSSNLKQHLNIHKSAGKRCKYVCFVNNCFKAYLYICTLKKHLMFCHKKNFEALEQVYLEMNFFEIFKTLVKTKNIAESDERLKFVKVKQTLSSTDNSELIDDNNNNNTGLNNYNGLNKCNSEEGKLINENNLQNPNSQNFNNCNNTKFSGNVTDVSYNNFNTLREFYKTKVNSPLNFLDQEKIKMANNLNQIINSQINPQYNNYFSGLNPQLMNNMSSIDKNFNYKYGLLNQYINNNFENASNFFYQNFNFKQNNNNNVMINFNNPTNLSNIDNRSYQQGWDYNTLNQMYVLLKNQNPNI